MRRSLPLLIAGVGVVLAACSDQGPGPATTTPSVASSFNLGAHFFFLPPLMKTQPTTGEFNPDLAPVVEICQLSGNGGTCLTTPAPIVFRTNIPGQFGELITVSTIAEQYQVGWNTSSYKLPNHTFWRITARTEVGGGTVFGFIDVWIAKAANELKNTPAGNVGVLNTSNVPIKFRIERGALCNDPATCIESSFGPGGGTFTTPNDDAGFRAPADALDPGEVVNLIVERYHGPDPCLPVFDPQYEGCYRYYTEPHVENFDLPVILGQCLDLAGQAVYSQLSLWKWDEVDPNTLVELPSVDVSDFVTCPEDLASADRKTGFFASASKLLKPLTGFLGVKPLHAKRAGPPPIGAGALDLSRVGPRRQLSINKESGDNQTATVGAPVNVSVKVTSTKTGEPVAGVPVDFAALTGGSATSPVNTDALGIASSSWTMGTVGANSLRADGNNPRPIWPGQPGVFGSVTFSGTGVAPAATFMPPIRNNPAGTNLPGLSITVNICELTATGCGATLVDLTPVLSGDGSVYQADWITPTTLDPSKVYRITVFAATINSESIKVEPAAAGGFKVGNYQFTAGQTVPIVFRVQ